MATASIQLDPTGAILYSTGQPAAVTANGTNFPVSGKGFDDTSVEQIAFEFKIPFYLSGNITVNLKWYAAATTGNVVWGAQLAAITAGDAQSMLTDGLATAATTTTAASTTSNGPKATQITITAVDSAAADDSITLRIYRDAAAGGDTMTGDAILFEVEVTYAATGGVGAGDVTGPGSATDNAIARFDATTGKVLQNSACLVADTTGSLDNSAASGQMTSTRFIGPATGLRETGGPTDLTIQSIVTQQLLKRSGPDIIGIDFFRFVLGSNGPSIGNTLTVSDSTTLSAGRDYLFEIWALLLNSSATSSTVTFNLNYDNTITRMVYEIEVWLAAGTSATARNVFNSNNQSVTATVASTGLYICKIAGSINASANGNLQFRLQRSTGGTVAEQAGSYLTAYET